jgi:hypothetical protein
MVFVGNAIQNSSLASQIANKGVHWFENEYRIYG